MSRTCHFCQSEVPDKMVCQPCVDHWPDRPSPHTMTADEREEEMVLLDGPLEVPFELVHGRIESLVGRPVWTHEMAANWEGLCKEARWENRPATMNEILALIPAEQRIIVSAAGSRSDEE